MGCYHTTAFRHLQNLNHHKETARWTSHHLSEAATDCRVNIGQSLLLRPQRKDFLGDVIAGGSWVLYDDVKRRAFWLSKEQEPPSDPKVNRHQHKVILSCWFDSRVMVYYELLHKGVTVPTSVYVQQLEKMAAAVREK
ncbi:unnamed protein product [Cylicostephanus goldi]|uniref:Uncharacterized protein n=1 Tax=Cylicostephanus goldi TaxID=71465 RepID=A0A3P6RH34_CYLGO|nr:unnamed protein product [Cylicostephanus goldi]